MSNLFIEVTIEDYIHKYCALNIDVDIYNEICLEEEQADFRTQRLFFDPSFQRIYGAWNPKGKSKYIKSVFMDTTYTPIVLTKIRKGDQKENLMYSCLDGQHRTTVVAEFINNKFGINTEMDFGKGSRKYKNTFFRDLSVKDKRRFLKSKIIIHIVETNRPHEDVFININDGASLNAQEKRNAIQCYMARWSRKCYDAYKDNVLERISGVRSKLERMSGHEYVSKVYLSLINQLLLNNPDERNFVSLDNVGLDSLYNRDQKINNKVTDYIYGDYLPSLIAVANNLRKNKNQVIKKADLWVFMVLHSLFTLEENLEYSDISQDFSSVDFWNFSCELSNKLSSKSRLKQAIIEKKYADGIIDAIKYGVLSATYFHINVSRPHVGQSSKSVFNEIREAIDGDVYKAIKQYQAEKLRKKIAAA